MYARPEANNRITSNVSDLNRRRTAKARLGVYREAIHCMPNELHGRAARAERSGAGRTPPLASASSCWPTARSPLVRRTPMCRSLSPHCPPVLWNEPSERPSERQRFRGPTIRVIARYTLVDAGPRGTVLFVRTRRRWRVLSAARLLQSETRLSRPH